MGGQGGAIGGLPGSSGTGGLGGKGGGEGGEGGEGGTGGGAGGDGGTGGGEGGLGGIGGASEISLTTPQGIQRPLIPLQCVAYVFSQPARQPYLLPLLSGAPAGGLAKQMKTLPVALL